MTSQQKDLVQSSFAKVAPIADIAANLFYQKLFELDPRLRPLFKQDMREQKKKLLQMLTAAVHGLDDLGALVPAVRDLGARHGSYGVQDEHYDTVGEALLWTLDKGLGDEFTFETKEAWIVVYGVLSGTMKDAAKTVPLAK